MAMVSEFLAAVNQISAERGIDPEKVFSALEEAVLAAYVKENESEAELAAELDRDTGEFKIICKKTVVKKVENDATEISVINAQNISSELNEGDVVEMEMPVDDLGRIAAQTAKQVILQSIRESEKEAVLEEYSDKVGEVFTAMMQRMQGGRVVMEIGKATAFMPQEDQVHSEFYKVGERYKVLLKGIEDSLAGKELIVSRAAPDFLVSLFRIEVPELDSGVVEVKAVSREAGSRSKMAVISNQEGIDAIGSCVGQRGVRIANVMSELGEEKIDIIEWAEDIETFVANALSPAKIESVTVDGDVAVVVVAEDQLSLAIGKDGQNVRLAAKLTDIKIDIQGPDGKIESVGEDEDALGDNDDMVTEVDEVENQDDVENQELDEKLVKKLEKAGKTVDDVVGLSVDELVELEGIGKVTAQKIYDSLN